MSEKMTRQLFCDRCGRGEEYHAPMNERCHMTNGLRMRIYGANGESPDRVIKTLKKRERTVDYGYQSDMLSKDADLDLCSECVHALAEFLMVK